MALAKGDDLPGHVGADKWEALELLGSGPIQVDHWFGRPGAGNREIFRGQSGYRRQWALRPARDGKADLPAYSGKQTGADSRHPIQAFETSERSVRFTIGNDRAREGQPHTRQAGDLGNTGAIEIDGLPGREGPADGERRITMGTGRTRGPARQQAGLARRGIGGCGAPAQPLAQHGEAEQEEDGTALGGHGGN
jgi:hypothetical protein